MKDINTYANLMQVEMHLTLGMHCCKYRTKNNPAPARSGSVRTASGSHCPIDISADSLYMMDVLHLLNKKKKC
jgi:hypothetical protein